MSSVFFGRYCSLNLDGRLFKSPPFSIEFEIEIKSKGVAVSKVKLYNPSPETINKCKPIAKGKEIALPIVEIDAGYEDDHGSIFEGEIFSFKESFKRPDRVLELEIKDKSDKWGKADIQKSYRKLSISEIVKEISDEVGVKILRNEPSKNITLSSFYATNYATAINYLASVSESRYIIEFGKLVFESMDSVYGKATLLNFNTGLVEEPQLVINQNKKTATKLEQRYKIKSLFNHKIRNGSFLKLEYKKESIELKVVAGKHSFSSISDSFTEMECIVL